MKRIRGVIFAVLIAGAVASADTPTPTPTAQLDCSSPIVLTLATPVFSTTTGAASNVDTYGVSGSCAFSQVSSEKVCEFTATSTQSYKFRTRYRSGPMSVNVLDACHERACIPSGTVETTCSGPSCSSMPVSRSPNLTLSSGTYYVVIDAPGTTTSDFCITVLVNTPTPTPTNTGTQTFTSTPTNTHTQTPTGTPTNTGTQTFTNTPTDTPTATYTVTPTPACPDCEVEFTKTFYTGWGAFGLTHPPIGITHTGELADAMDSQGFGVIYIGVLRGEDWALDAWEEEDDSICLDFPEAVIAYLWLGGTYHFVVDQCDAIPPCSLE